MEIVHLATCACVPTLHSINYGLIGGGINLAQHISFVLKISLSEIKSCQFKCKSDTWNASNWQCVHWI